jgi:hypothetical protein
MISRLRRRFTSSPMNKETADMTSPRHFPSSAAAFLSRPRALGCAVSTIAVLMVGAVAASPAPAVETAPWWNLNTSLHPSTLPSGGEGTFIAQAVNVGNASTSGPSTLSATLPPGVSVVEEEVKGEEIPQVSFFALPVRFGHEDFGLTNGSAVKNCKILSNRISCSTEFEEGASRGENIPPLAPYEDLEIRVKVKDDGVAPGSDYGAEASGGGAAEVSRQRPLTIGAAAPAFGAERYSLVPEEPGGAVDTRAGSHPYQLTTTINLNQKAEFVRPGENEVILEAPALPRTLNFKLPPGQLGNALSVPQCSASNFTTLAPGETNECPEDTVIGVSSVTIFEPANLGLTTLPVPLFNLEPKPGEPARFGFEAVGAPVILDTSVRSGKGEDYGVTVTVDDISQLVNFVSSTVTFWGAPADSTHNESRGWNCLASGHWSASGKQEPCIPQSQPKPPAFLTLPTDCVAPFSTSVEGVSWPNVAAPAGASFDPFSYSLEDGAGHLLALTACNQVPFAPTIEAEPTSNAATSPTGLNFDINVDDQGLGNSEGLAQSQLKKAVVTLPEGFTTNPSVAEGLKACSEAEFDASTVQAGTGCLEESKVGEVEIESPLVKPTIHGSLFVARQKENPNNNLLTIYMVARNPEVGVIVKQALKVVPNPVTGQLTTEVDDIPQLPFSRFHLAFRQGQRSPLITPPACGKYAIKAQLYPWANSGAPVERESSFQITQGPEGRPCPSGNTPPFHPNLEAGTVNNAAGTYSPFYVHITRRDSEQEITHFSIKLPPGVSGKLAGVPECSDAAIVAAKAREHEGGGQEELNSPSCPAASEVGHSLVGSGVGNVLAYVPGKMYLAGPYHGSNLSLVSITAAKVGPFDLGTVVVRFALKINPETAEVSVDGQGSDPLPHIVDGIPVHLRDIRAYVDRPNFVLNPTSCAKTSTAATVLGSGLNFASEADDQPVTVTSPFQAADCASLGFKPNLALSLKGGTKRGATPAFKAVLTYPKGSYANVREAQVTLPSSEYLEQAHIGTVCTRVQFAAGTVPGERCPAASIYGKAKAVTPILGEPLEGPVYLRSSSHPLPDLVAALNNKQVNIDLDGHIDAVHKKGSEVSRIRNTFEMVPDAPVTSFTLEMQGGKKGLLVNSTNICKSTNRAISDLTGQNGKLSDTNPVLKAPCGGKGKKKSGSKKKTKG